MKKQKFLTLAFIALFFYNSYSQVDTIKMMQYNLMYYTTAVPSGCTVTSSYLNDKDMNLKKIIKYVQPDILSVNEIGSQSTYVDRIKNNALNTDGVTYYQNCPLTNFSGGSIANMVYYDSRKLGYHSFFYVTTSVRDINAYKMYYKTPQLANGDTIFITFIVTHLKAGSSDAEAIVRGQQTQALMTKLEQMGAASNYVFSGDFNLYSSSEIAYQNLINYSNTLYRFYDPINQSGNWNNSSQFANIHTQSTHTSSDNGCFSTGGMDDRFDFILVSPYIYYGSKKVRSINDSYMALGQDGQRFNGSINNPTNTSVPDSIANALYNLSDHLPVILQFAIDYTVSVQDFASVIQVNVNNPVQDQISMEIQLDQPDQLTFEIYSLSGQLLEKTTNYFESGSSRWNQKFEYPPSLYLLKIQNSKNQYVVKKIVKS
ncbi:MAG: Endonuclease/exonuclease/phosphatase [Bacteroidetes bacterium]|nr:Endonuclease/exonuclease/phosphatase [Bacteroidota bacterium]